LYLTGIIESPETRAFGSRKKQALTMTNEYYNERSNFKALIEPDGNDRLQERLNIIDAFLDTEDHITLEELFHLLRDRGFHYDPEFVRHCMNRVVDLGFAQRKQFEGQPVRYEHRHLGRHHDHLICTKCGGIVEFENDELERLQMKIAAAHGFHILQHRMEIYGLCGQCLAERRPVMPLAMAKPGERLLIKDMLGGHQAKARLSDMGLRCGDLVEIINNDGMGQIILAHDCTRLAMGRGIAQKIMVSTAEEIDGPVCENE
jgi:Fur family ferric uptake transcriptional regulator